MNSDGVHSRVARLGRAVAAALSRSTSAWIGRAGGDMLGGSRFGWNIVGALAALLGLAVVATWVLSSYFRVDVPATMSFLGDDGWCDRYTEAVGVHCWGDFSAIRFDSPLAQPSLAEAVYPLSSRIIRIPFAVVQAIGGFRAALLLFVLVSAAAMLLPLVWAVRRTPLPFKPVVLTTLGLATAPFLVLWDRGNILALIVPLLFLLLFGLARDRPWLIAIAVIAMSSVKPQFALLGLALIALRYWRHAAVSLVGSLVVVVLPFFAYGSGWLTAIFEWVASAGRFSMSQSLGTSWPGNVSFAEALYLLGTHGPLAGIAQIPERGYVLAAIGLAGAVVVAILVAGRSLPPVAIGIALLAVVSLTSPISYAYYLVFAIPVVAIVFREGLAGWPMTGLGKGVPVLLGVALVLSLSPLLVPVDLRLTSPVASALPITATFAWGAFLVSIALWGILIRAGGRLAREQEVRI